MKSLLELPSKKFIEFLDSVQEYQQTDKYTCTFWMNMIACFCRVEIQPWHIFVKIQPIDDTCDIGNGCGCSVERMFKRDDIVDVILNSVEDGAFLDRHAQQVKINGETWCYCPYWFKKNEDGTFNVVQFDDLPKYLVDFIKEERDTPKKEDLHSM